ncbi:MAG: NfeD family protein [Bacillota bacterium]
MDIFGFISNLSWISGFLFMLGFILVIVEMHMPGFGLPGISGTILLIMGIFLTAKSLIDALVLIIIILALLGMSLILVLQSATKGRLSKHLILNESLNKESGYIGTEDLEYLLGKEGRALTVLRPSGTGDFDGVRLDVVTEGEYIEKDENIRIIKVQGRRIVVKAV